LPADSTDQAWTRGANALVHRVKQIIAHGVPVVVVFDCPLTSPAKAEERARRRAARMASVAARSAGRGQTCRVCPRHYVVDSAALAAAARKFPSASASTSLRARGQT
jgi:hypothetical protein